MSTRAEVDECYAILKTLHQRGEMTEEAYMMGLVRYATQHAREGRFEDARMLLNECSGAYFSEVLPAQMRADPDFEREAAWLALQLYDRGVTRVSEEDLMLAFTQPGRA